MNNRNYFLALAVFLMAAAQLSAQQFFFSPERPGSCAATDGIITIVPIRGVPPFTYLWSDGSTGCSLCVDRGRTAPAACVDGPGGERGGR